MPVLLSSMTPASGPFSGETHITIEGENFTDTSEILIQFSNIQNTVSVPAVFVNRTILTCIAPVFESPSFPVSVNVTVALNGQQFLTNSLAYTYYGT